jgi:hypothetical protein
VRIPPRLTRENRSNRTGVHSELPCELAHRLSATASNVSNIAFGQLCSTVSRPARRPTTRNAICDVIRMGAKFEMCRFAASRVIAPMTHDKPRWNALVVGQHPHGPRDEDRRPFDGDRPLTFLRASNPIQAREVESRHRVAEFEPIEQPVECVDLHLFRREMEILPNRQIRILLLLRISSRG